MSCDEGFEPNAQVFIFMKMPKKDKTISPRLVVPEMSAIEKNAVELLRFIKERGAKFSPLLIMTHNYPDPDALATANALAYLAEQGAHVKSRIVYGGSIGRGENKAMVRHLRMPVFKVKPADLKKFAHVALIDTQPQFENHSCPSRKHVAIVVDQHPSVKKTTSELSIVNEDCGATSVIVTRALLLSGLEIPKRVATALVYGILSDTQNLNRVENPEIIQTYLDILPYCDMRALTRIQNPSKPAAFFKTLRYALNHAQLCRGFVMVHLGFIPHPDLVSEIADFILGSNVATRALCTGRYLDKLHISFRTRRPHDDAPKILRNAVEDPTQAGGHDSIAGGNFKVSSDPRSPLWKEKEARLTQKLLKQLKIPSRQRFSAAF